MKKKTPRAILVLKEDRQALGLLVFKCADKKAVFHYPLTLGSPAIPAPNGKLYQPTAKHLFSNELIKLSCDSIEKNPPKNAVRIYDRIAILTSAVPQKTWGDLWR